MTHTLLTASFIAGLIPSILLFLFYGIRVRWERSLAGVVLFSLISVFALSYGLSIVTLLFPDVFAHGNGVWVRIGIRFAIAGVLWALLVLFFRAQRRGTDERSKK